MEMSEDSSHFVQRLERFKDSFVESVLMQHFSPLLLFVRQASPLLSGQVVPPLALDPSASPATAPAPAPVPVPTTNSAASPVTEAAISVTPLSTPQPPPSPTRSPAHCLDPRTFFNVYISEN